MLQLRSWVQMHRQHELSRGRSPGIFRGSRCLRDNLRPLQIYVVRYATAQPRCRSSEAADSKQYACHTDQWLGR